MQLSSLWILLGLVPSWWIKWGLGNKFLSHIREVDAIVQVLRHFQDNDVTHVEGPVDPLRDMDIINTELIFADLQQIEKALPAIRRRQRQVKMFWLHRNTRPWQRSTTIYDLGNGCIECCMHLHQKIMNICVNIISSVWNLSCMRSII